MRVNLFNTNREPFIENLQSAPTTWPQTSLFFPPPYRANLADPTSVNIGQLLAVSGRGNLAYIYAEVNSSSPNGESIIIPTYFALVLPFGSDNLKVYNIKYDVDASHQEFLRAPPFSETEIGATSNSAKAYRKVFDYRDDRAVFLSKSVSNEDDLATPRHL